MKRILSNTIKRSIRSFSSHRASIDVHTHMYFPKYMDVLKSRTDVPYVREINNENRLVILPGEDSETTTAVGRPIGKEYYDVNAKLAYMDKHGIDISCISLANPWLDFIEGDAAENIAQELNDELQGMCEDSNGRLLGFATLPVKNHDACLRELERLKTLKHIKGVILGTPGAGHGLDHIGMRDILAKIEDMNYMVFLHPHYGVGVEHYHDTGHALFLALGFPFETTVSVSRMIVTGTLDHVPNLKLLVAHAGAAMPSLIGRLDSCVAHDYAIASNIEHAPSDYLKRMYFDAIAYSGTNLKGLIDHVGSDRIMFGTDNPFFPPPDLAGDEDVSQAVWPSTEKVYHTINDIDDDLLVQKILRENAKKIFDI